MNQTGEAVSNLPAILVLSMWWAFLSNLDLLFGPPRFGQAEGEGSGGADDADADRDAGPHDPRLLELVAVDPAFSAEAFLVGARRAYEEILRCYAGRELEGLRPLLSPEVLSAFAEACALRAERGETLEMTFVGIDAAEIADAGVTADVAEISVLFRAEIVSAVRSPQGAVLSGDPAAVTVTQDLWTFSRLLGDAAAAWVLVATE